MQFQRLSRRFFSIGGASEEIGTYTLTRGRVGRKVFKKEWSHLQARYPQTLQERWHRASVERLFNPSIIEQVVNIPKGELDTFDFRLHFETSALDASSSEPANVIDEYKKLSPWHDIPLGFIDTNTNQLLFNFVNEIPRGGRAKMECATDEEWNPIKQDTKKGKLRYFAYGDLPFNYGFIPQTWEDPNESSHLSDVAGLGGDNDPVDVCEISNESLPLGQIIPIKVLAVLGLIDEGETDWKIIGLRADHPLIDEIHSMTDAFAKLNIDSSSIILDWFTNYKVPDGKPQNVFTHAGEYRDSQIAIQVIEECHRQWYNLLLGAADSSKLSLMSVAHKHLLAQGLTTNETVGELPHVSYPRYDRWQAQTVTKMHNIDRYEEQTDINEPTSDQAKK